MTVPTGWSAKPIRIVRFPSGNIDYLGFSGTAPETEAGRTYLIQAVVPNGDGTKRVLAQAEVRIGSHGYFNGRYGWSLGHDAPNGAEYTYEIRATPGEKFAPTGPSFPIGTGTTTVQL